MHRRRRLAVFSVFAIALGQSFWFARGTKAEEIEGTWRTDFAAAEAEAEREQKPLLVHFSATWCLPCSKMDRDVLKSKDVKQLLRDRVIGVKVDSDQHPDLVDRYNIKLLPSDVIIDPTNGRVLKESQGARDLKGYLALANQGVATFEKSLAAQLASKTNQPTPAKPTVSDNEVASALSIELGDPKSLIGVDGYSPVALTKHRKWIRGSADYAWDYQGVTYQFSSKAELQAFRANPEAYAPRLLGCDPVILWETDRAVAGRTQYGAFFDEQLYFFTNAENRRRFKANPERFIKTQHVLKVDQIDRTALLDDSALK
jgi:YHS domain-containing protein/thiol-disulfide isomerase/thioredoxin